MLGDFPDISLVACGREIDRPPLRPRFVDQRKDVRIVRKVGRVDGRDARNIRLEATLSRLKRCGERKYPPRIWADMSEKGFDQKISWNERPVEVNDQRQDGRFNFQLHSHCTPASVL